MSCPKLVRCVLPGTVHNCNRVLPTTEGAPASIRPTTKATRYVDILIVSAKRTIFSSSRVSETTRLFDTAVRLSSMTSVVEKTALKPGSSQHGKASRVCGFELCCCDRLLAPALIGVGASIKAAKFIVACPEKPICSCHVPGARLWDCHSTALQRFVERD